MIESWLTALLAVAHVLGGAAWFGAMIYSLTVLQPRAVLFFARPEQFEEFLTFISHGARWKVLAAFGMMAGTGLGLALLRPSSGAWLALMAAKAILFLAALGVFLYVSWRLWPARVLALPEEIPAIQRKFRIIGRVMIALVGLNLVIGVIAHRL